MLTINAFTGLFSSESQRTKSGSIAHLPAHIGEILATDLQRTPRICGKTTKGSQEKQDPRDTPKLGNSSDHSDFWRGRSEVAFRVP